MGWMFIPDRLVWVFQKLLSTDFHSLLSLELYEKQRHPVNRSSVGRNALGHRRMASLIRADRTATVTSISTFYNYGEHTSISELTRDQTLRGVDFNNRRPHRASLLSAKNMNLRLEVHWNWTAENWNNLTWYYIFAIFNRLDFSVSLYTEFYRLG